MASTELAVPPLAPSRTDGSTPASADIRSGDAIDRAVRVGAGSTLWLALLLVACWWDVDGGVGALGGTLTLALTSLGQLAGLVASVLLLVQVALMARLPVLESAFGQDRLARQHRIVGFSSFTLMLVHIVLITWGYAAGAVLRVPGELWSLTWTYPGMLLAAAGSLCLVLVVVTSLRAARRRLRYESWHLLHLYAYVGVGLALPHQLWTGTEFVTHPVRRVVWWTAWAAVAAAVLVFRVGRPVVLNLRHRLHVVAVRGEADGVYSIELGGRRLDRLPVQAGQFCLWRFLDGPGWSRANPYSLSAAPSADRLRITVQAVGDRSRATAVVRPGTRVLFEGAYGRMSARVRTRPKVALIGAGVGMAPMRALAEGLDYRPGEAVLIERYTTTPLFAPEVDAMVGERGLAVLRLPGPRRAPDSWFGPGLGAASDLDALLHWVPDIGERDVYLCGPPTWTRLVLRTLEQAGTPRDHIHDETFSW